MNIQVIKSAWRRIRRPSAKTLRDIRRLETDSRFWPNPVMSPAELQKFALQNTALLFVRESHARGYSNLSPAALGMVERALNRCGAPIPTAA